jgi:hypothetical protein
MLTVTRSTRPGLDCATGAYHALDSLIQMLRIASVPQRKICLDQLIEHDVINICLEVCHPNLPPAALT